MKSDTETIEPGTSSEKNSVGGQMMMESSAPAGEVDMILDFLACPIVPGEQDILPRHYRKDLPQVNDNALLTRFFPSSAIALRTPLLPLQPTGENVFSLPIYHTKAPLQSLPFQIGSRIQHPRFGMGLVTHIFAIQSQTIILRVAFEYGENRLIDSETLLRQAS